MNPMSCATSLTLKVDALPSDNGMEEDSGSMRIQQRTILYLILSALWLYSLPSASTAQLLGDGDRDSGNPLNGVVRAGMDDSSGAAFGTTRSTRIVGGEEAGEGDWPFMAALIDAGQAPDGGQFCGGALIDPKWVVTAAHCVVSDSGSVTAARDIEVILGIHDLKSDTEYGRFKVQRIIPHPSYDPQTTDSDIALIELVDNASGHIPIPYATGSDPYDGVDATAIGWGSTSATGKAYPDTLQQVTLPIVTNATCSGAYGGDQITDNMMCAGFSDGGKDSCQGDSGGPLVIQDQDTTRLAGVVSWGIGCAEPGYYGVYARVTQFTDFIEQYVQPSTAPEAFTNAATEVGSDAAVLNGTVNPNGISTTFHFEYGLSQDYGSQTTTDAAGSGSTDTPVAAAIAGLSPNATYHYRVVATNSSGAASGADRAFTTSGAAVAPTVATAPATSVSSRSAVLNGTVNPHGSTTQYYFEYRRDLGSWIRSEEKGAGSGTNLLSVSEVLTDLMPDTTYRYRIGAASAVGTSTGSEESFTTPVTQPPVAVDDHAATAADTAISVDVLANDHDPDGDILVVTAVTDPLNGIAVIGTDQKTVTYTPDTGFIGIDTFDYTTGDGTETSDATVTVSVGEGCVTLESVDTPLIIPDGDLSGITSTIHVSRGGTVEDVDVVVGIRHEWVGDLSAILISPIGTEVVLFDREGGSGMNFSDTTLDDDASQEISEGIPPFSGHFRPAESLSVLARESLAGDWELKVTDSEDIILGKLRYWRLAVCYTPMSGNQAPVAEDDAASTLRNKPVLIDVLANDYDVNSDALSLVSVTDPPNGVAAANPDRTVLYTPDIGFIGEDTFSYAISDGKGAEDTGAVTVAVREDLLIQDGSFEAGTPSLYWDDQSQLFGENLYRDGFAHTGEWFVWFAGGDDWGGAETASVSQPVTIPAAHSVTLRFWLWVLWWDVPGEFLVMLDDQVVFSAGQAQASSYDQWTEISVDVSQFADGDEHRLRFSSEISTGDLSTDIFLDDIALTVGALRADLDGDDTAGLRDLVIALRTVVGMDTAGLLRTGYAASGTDVNGDGEAGLAEAVYIIRQMAR